MTREMAGQIVPGAELGLLAKAYKNAGADGIFLNGRPIAGRRSGGNRNGGNTLTDWIQDGFLRYRARKPSPLMGEGSQVAGARQAI